MIDPKNLIRENIKNLSPYSTARDEYDGPLGIYMDANESPYDNGYNRYPDPRQKLLKKSLSEIKKIPANNIFIGNGSDEPIDLVFRIFCEPGKDNALSIAPTYGMYKVAAAINDIEMREVQLNEKFELDVQKLLDSADEFTKLIFICSPNNPTGNSFPRSEIEKVIKNFSGMVILDEAYIDFSRDVGFLQALSSYPNLIILQTLSKAWGMAGLRLGLAYAREDIVEIMSRVKYPYNINLVTQKIVLQQLSEDIDSRVAELKLQRELIEKKLLEYDVIKEIFPSDANFILVRVEDPGYVYSELIEGGIIVRDRSKVKGCEGCLRITVGTPEENIRLFEILEKLS